MTCISIENKRAVVTSLFNISMFIQYVQPFLLLNPLYTIQYCSVTDLCFDAAAGRCFGPVRFRRDKLHATRSVFLCL